MKNSREIAYDIIYNIIYKNLYSNIQINKFFSDDSVSRIDKAFITELVYGAIEKKLYLEHILSKYINIPLKKLSREVYVVLIMGIYQIAFMNSVTDFAGVDESVKLCKKIQFRSNKFVNAVLRNMLRDENYLEIKAKNKLDYLSIKYSISKDIIKLLQTQYIDYERILIELNKKADIYIRPNRLKVSTGELFALLEKDFDCEIAGEYSVKIRMLNNISNNELFKNGYFTVQDLSSTDAILAMEPKQNEKILDLCAAPGGKTTFIAELMSNKGEIYAFDIAKQKLKMIDDTAKRLGIGIIKTKENNAEIFDKTMENRFDKVLADVPCSGIGIIRRKPEIRYKTLDEIKNLYDIQKNILTNAGKYVRKGGVLLYSTCSINKEENEKQVEKFLENNNFKLILEKTFLFEENQSDGFYFAKMEKME